MDHASGLVGKSQIGAVGLPDFEVKLEVFGLGFTDTVEQFVFHLIFKPYLRVVYFKLLIVLNICGAQKLQGEKQVLLVRVNQTPLYTFQQLNHLLFFGHVVLIDIRLLHET